MIEFAKYVGLTLVAMVFLAIPALLVLSIVFNWSILRTILLAVMVLAEMFIFVITVKTLDDEELL